MVLLSTSQKMQHQHIQARPLAWISRSGKFFTWKNIWNTRPLSRWPCVGDTQKNDVICIIWIIRITSAIYSEMISSLWGGAYGRTTCEQYISRAPSSVAKSARITFCQSSFLSRVNVSLLTRDIDIKNLSVRPSVPPSVTFRYSMKTA